MPHYKGYNTPQAGKLPYIARPDGAVEQMPPVTNSNSSEFQDVGEDGSGAFDVGQDNRDKAGF